MKDRIIDEMAKQAGQEINENITKNKDVIIHILRDSIEDAKASKKRSDILHFSIIIILILGFFGYAVYSQNKFADFMMGFEYETVSEAIDIEQDLQSSSELQNSLNINTKTE